MKPPPHQVDPEDKGKGSGGHRNTGRWPHGHRGGEGAQAVSLGSLEYRWTRDLRDGPRGSLQIQGLGGRGSPVGRAGPMEPPLQRQAWPPLKPGSAGPEIGSLAQSWGPVSL